MHNTWDFVFNIIIIILFDELAIQNNIYNQRTCYYGCFKPEMRT